jgi:phosphopentomutase
VDNHIVIADNIETDYGLNINVVGSLDHYSFDTIERIGRIVRAVVRVGRVITMGGKGIDIQAIKSCFEIKQRDGYTAWGVNIPKLNIYDEHYCVIHMGYGVNEHVQTPEILCRASIPVTLIGKTADVIQARGAEYIPAVQTELVLQKLIEKARLKSGFIFANVQETDLSGHKMDGPAYEHHLQLVDQSLPALIATLGSEDSLIITGDHGNDPYIGHTNHTREYTPIIMFAHNGTSRDLGVRTTLSDIGATIADYFKVTLPENGTSFLSL